MEDEGARTESASCAACGRELCGRQAVIHRILGGRGELRCLDCLAERLAATPEQLCALVGRYLVQRECYRRAWESASVCALDGQAACCPSRLETATAPIGGIRAAARPDAPGEPLPAVDLAVDAEEAGCGDLMVLLMRSIRRLRPGQVLALTARDPGAPADIPSWCRLTGHTLLAGPADPDGATYYIRKASGG